MADATAASKTSYSNLDWNHYNKYRPPYPQSLKRLIYAYHDRHSNAASRELLVDVGGGVGISSIPYLADFETVHLLDPSALNHEKARVFLSEHVRSQNLATKLEFTVARAEEGCKHVSNVSMAVCATAAHFIDPDGLISSMASMLLSGGTMAIYTYWMPTFPDVSPALGLAFAKAATTAMRFCIRPGDEVTRALFEKVAARLMAGETILDFMPVPKDLFEDITRIRINPEAEIAFETYRSDPPVPCEPLPSQVSSDEKMIQFTSAADPEGEGWSFPVNLEWMHGMLSSVIPADLQLSQAQYDLLYGELDKTFAAECRSGTVRALCAVGVILARRMFKETVR